MKKLMILMTLLSLLVALLALAASAATGPYTLVLITQGKHFKAQLGTFTTLRECIDEGTEILTDQDIYIGFGCIIEEDL
jgi:hypothetical protein